MVHVRENAENFGGNPDRIHVAGHSAGAHIAAMLLSADCGSPDGTTGPRAIRGAVAISGIYDLAPIRQLPVNEELRLSSADVEDLSPIRNIPPAGGSPCPGRG